MKKVIKKYLTQLHENEEKGFSLVELIIVMAIMAVLVGVVASQVIPYMEKSRQSTDQQQISSIATSLVSAIAQDPNFDQSNLPGGATSINFKLTDLGTSTTATIDTTFAELCGASNTAQAATNVKNKFKSKKAKNANDIYVTLHSNGVVQVDVGSAAGSPASPKLQVSTE